MIARTCAACRYPTGETDADGRCIACGGRMRPSPQATLSLVHQILASIARTTAKTAEGRPLRRGRG